MDAYWACMEKAMNTFTEHTSGAATDSWTGEELSSFLTKYFLKGKRIDLFTGTGAGSMKPAKALSLASLTAIKVGEFKGCPPG